MSRASSGETVIVKPSANIYTVLVVSAVIVEIIGIVAVAARHAEIFKDLTSGKYLFF